MAAIETRLNELNEALSQTEKMLEKSRAEIQALHSAAGCSSRTDGGHLGQRHSLGSAGCEDWLTRNEARGHARAAGRDAGRDQATRPDQGGDLWSR